MVCCHHVFDQHQEGEVKRTTAVVALVPIPTTIKMSLGIAAYSCVFDSKSGVQTGRLKSPSRISGLRTVTPSSSKTREKWSSSSAAAFLCELMTSSAQDEGAGQRVDEQT